jgi:hypothetical protein
VSIKQLIQFFCSMVLWASDQQENALKRSCHMRIPGLAAWTAGPCLINKLMEMSSVYR